MAPQVMAAELEALGARVDAMEAVVVVAMSRIQVLEQQVASVAAQGPVALAKFLADWWAANVGRLKTSVAAQDFMQKLLAWCRANQ